MISQIDSNIFKIFNEILIQFSSSVFLLLYHLFFFFFFFFLFCYFTSYYQYDLIAEH